MSLKITTSKKVVIPMIKKLRKYQPTIIGESKKLGFDLGNLQKYLHGFSHPNIKSIFQK